MDEHRLGLKPVLRRVWARRGRRPSVRVCHRPGTRCGGCRLYLYRFVRPAISQTLWLLMPSVNSGAVSSALEHFAREAGRGVPCPRCATLAGKPELIRSHRLFHWWPTAA